MNHTPQRLQVAFVPVDRANPYNRRLAEALESLGVVANLEGNFKSARNLLADRRSKTVLHLHWLPAARRGYKNVWHFVKFAGQVSWMRSRGAVVVWTAHNLYSHESESKRRERMLATYILRLASGVIAHCTSAVALVREEFRVSPRTKFSVIPHGNFIGCFPDAITRTEARGRLGLAQNHKAVLFLGNIRPYKGVESLVRAFKSVDIRDSRLIIAGRPLSDAMRDRVLHEIGGDERVLLRPEFVKDEEIQMYLKASDVVALPYKEILTSGAAVLAMSFGLPCVAPRMGFLQEAFELQQELLYEVGEPQGLESALRLALGDKERLRQLGELNMHKASQWNWDSVARQTLDFYHSCCWGRANGKPVMGDREQVDSV